MNVIADLGPADRQAEFPFAPANWRSGDAERMAREEGIELGPDHWRLLHSLQEYYSRQTSGKINVRKLKDALEEAFHKDGGIRYLHELFPGGPVAQGCRLAGLPVPPGAVDESFGSVQ